MPPQDDELQRLDILLGKLKTMALDVRTLSTSYSDDVVIQSYIIQAEIKLQAAIQTVKQVMKSL
jgi:hypothetical protein